MANKGGKESGRLARLALRLLQYCLPRKSLEDQCIIATSVLAEFHKYQCYFSIAMQIASLVTIITNMDSTSAINQDYLFLASINGLVPIILTLYTLMTFGVKSWYIIILSIITIILSSAARSLLSAQILGVRATYGNVIMTRGSGPSAACGNVGAMWMCEFIGPNTAWSYKTIPQEFLAAMVGLDTVAVSLVLWKLCTETTNAWETASRWITNRVFHQRGKCQAAGNNQTASALLLMVQIVLHSLTTVIILGYVGIELYEFHDAFRSSDWSWGFGQTVGIATWAGIIVELVYLECSESSFLLPLSPIMHICTYARTHCAYRNKYYIPDHLTLDGVEEGLAWRFPPWLEEWGQLLPH
jgi:hypothetical protein